MLPDSKLKLYSFSIKNGMTKRLIISLLADDNDKVSDINFCNFC